MRFETTLDPSGLPNSIRQMVGIAGWQSWKRRVESLRAVSGKNPAWDRYLIDRHGLEMAFGEIHHYLQTRGRYLWPPRTAEQYRFYSFASVAARVHHRLSERARRRFTGAMRNALKKEFGLAPLAFEMKIVTHLINRGFDVDFHDLESGGGFDFLASRQDTQVEVECKHISADIGRQIHRRKLHDLGGTVYPEIARAIDQGCGGRFLQVTLPGRLTSDKEQQSALSQRIASVLSGGAKDVNDEVCRISAQTFDLDASPFTASRGHELSTDDIEDFLSSKFEVNNAHVLSNWRPGRAAVLIHVQSMKPDKVLGEMVKHLKSDAKKQFSGDLPGFLCVHLADLNREQLFDLFETAHRGDATGIKLAVNHLLERRPHVYGIALMADGEVQITNETSGSSVTNSIQEVGPSYVIKNAYHPLAGTALIDQMFADATDGIYRKS